MRGWLHCRWPETVSGVRFIDYPGELLVADTNHKWGISLFHYLWGDVFAHDA
ncbi:DUF6270 domain-containing protein [Novilysobacter erysipheiresistens]|uniref:DUF6270 domain-containing protein n=1 Tax=Novilysobacter erysipheiresistens TaxID=1749332 RepID=UPI003CE45DC4